MKKRKKKKIAQSQSVFVYLISIYRYNSCFVTQAIQLSVFVSDRWSKQNTTLHLEVINRVTFLNEILFTAYFILPSFFSSLSLMISIWVRFLNRVWNNNLYFTFSSEIRKYIYICYSPRLIVKIFVNTS